MDAVASRFPIPRVGAGGYKEGLRLSVEQISFPLHSGVKCTTITLTGRGVDMNLGVRMRCGKVGRLGPTAVADVFWLPCSETSVFIPEHVLIFSGRENPFFTLDGQF